MTQTKAERKNEVYKALTITANAKGQEQRVEGERCAGGESTQCTAGGPAGAKKCLENLQTRI